MTLAVFVALIAVSLTLVGIATIQLCERTDRIDYDLKALVLSKQISDDLTAQADELGWRR